MLDDIPTAPNSASSSQLHLHDEDWSDDEMMSSFDDLGVNSFVTHSVGRLRIAFLDTPMLLERFSRELQPVKRRRNTTFVSVSQREEYNVELVSCSSDTVKSFLEHQISQGTPVDVVVIPPSTETVISAAIELLAPILMFETDIPTLVTDLLSSSSSLRQQRTLLNANFYKLREVVFVKPYTVIPYVPQNSMCAISNVDPLGLYDVRGLCIRIAEQLLKL